MKNKEIWCKYNDTDCQVINFADQRQHYRTTVHFMSTAYILFYIQSSTEEPPPVAKDFVSGLPDDFEKDVASIPGGDFDNLRPS
jgi:hypothetical protein